MKIKLFATREIHYFKLGIFSCDSYVYYLTRGFIASTHAFNFPTRAFNLGTRAFGLLTHGFEPVTHRFELVTRRFEFVTRGFELVAHGFEVVTCGFELVTRILLFHHEELSSFTWKKVTNKLPANIFRFCLRHLVFSLANNSDLHKLKICNNGLCSLCNELQTQLVEK